MSSVRCVYTCLFGDYEELLEQPVSADSNMPFVCFTDNPRLESATWQIRKVDSLLPMDPARSSRHPKICAHEYLTDFDESLYIDNSIKLTKDPGNIFRNLMEAQPYNMVCLGHSFRETIDDEFKAVEQVGYDFPSVLRNMYADYKADDYDFTAKPMWGGFLLRRHNEPDIKRCMNTWFANVLRYSRRDQLSFDYAVKRTALKLTVHHVNIRSTDFHVWPASKRFGSARVTAQEAPPSLRERLFKALSRSKQSS